MYDYLLTSIVYLVYDIHNTYSKQKPVNYHVSKWIKIIWIWFLKREQD